MNDLQAVERCLALLMEKHYLLNNSVLSSPLFEDVNRLHQQVRKAVDQQQDNANQEAFLKLRTLRDAVQQAQRQGNG